jgi:hypothetical protein
MYLLIVINNEYRFSPIIKHPGRPGYPSEADLEKSEKLEG